FDNNCFYDAVGIRSTPWSARGIAIFDLPTCVLARLIEDLPVAFHGPELIEHFIVAGGWLEPGRLIAPRLPVVAKRPKGQEQGHDGPGCRSSPIESGRRLTVDVALEEKGSRPQEDRRAQKNQTKCKEQSQHNDLPYVPSP